jgi:hypothetical protein
VLLLLSLFDNSSLLELLLFLKLSHSHLVERLLNLQPVLSSCDDASLSDLLPILMVENHAHGVFKVLELLRIDVDDHSVLELALLDQWEQDVSSQCLHFEVEMLGHLALLQAFVYSSDVLSKGRVIIVFDAVVGSI